MDFAWNGRSSEKAVVCLSIARVMCDGQSVGQAFQATIHSGNYCIHPDSIPEAMVKQLEQSVKEQLQSIERERAKRPHVEKRLPDPIRTGSKKGAG